MMPNYANMFQDMQPPAKYIIGNHRFNYIIKRTGSQPAL